ncbi:substrate-binding domain-containing protein [Poseidonocella sp. HB161398]|uniref:substrate-binding domain-containing protein n=1 Tax=Poseidonocella sp. HB161398 TaxID=2320855 RepID=UPI00110898F9|nr:substrate-binding domain-containing protein [Poseidonocella sp. HB161398]
MTGPFRAVLALAAALSWAAPLPAADLFVIGGKPDDPFWTIVRRGAEDAAAMVEAQAGSVTWLGLDSYDNLGADAAALIREAVARGADGLVAPDWQPEVMDPAFREAAAAGIPFVIYNAGGREAADRLGALAYIGSDNAGNGEAAGRYFADHGFTRAVCINTLPGLANIREMCDGMAAGLAAHGGQGEMLVLEEGSFGDRSLVSDAVKAHLLANPQVTGVFAIGNFDAGAVDEAIIRAGKAGRVKFGGTNLDGPALAGIRAGSQLFAVDQQGYLQGVLGVTLLNAHVNFGLTLPEGQILTGPGLVDLSNIDLVERGISRGAR